MTLTPETLRPQVTLHLKSYEQQKDRGFFSDRSTLQMGVKIVGAFVEERFADQPRHNRHGCVPIKATIDASPVQASVLTSCDFAGVPSQQNADVGRASLDE
jgi:hypothetical protein